MARNVQAGKYGALPYLLRRQRSKPHACSFRIPTAIFATFAHLVSARECGNEASHVTLSAVEVQQVVARLTTMEVINVAPPSPMLRGLAPKCPHDIPGGICIVPLWAPLG